LSPRQYVFAPTTEPSSHLGGIGLGLNLIGAPPPRASLRQTRGGHCTMRVPPVDSVDDPPPASILHADLGSKFSAD